MIVTTRLLTTGSVVGAVISRNAHIVALQREFKIGRTRDAILKRWAIGELRKISCARAVVQNHVDSMPSVVRSRRSEETSMEPLLELREVNKSLPNYDGSDRATENFDASGELCDNNISELIDVDETMGGEYARHRGAMTRQKYASVRPWIPVGAGTANTNLETHFVVKVLSYNILAQNLLESHRYLYFGHNPEALDWGRRMVLVQQEILQAEANVVCLQEVLIDHLDEFLVVFKRAGYDYLYKRRTNDKRDGLLLLYRADQLKLVDHAEVELYQPDIDVLNRDNVAIVAKFSLIESPETRVVVSTTHLLYNPKRNDVRLAQTQFLFAELEKLAFVKSTKKGPRYHPIILCGDFNLQPNTGVYRFITDGSFEFRGRNRSLEPATFCGLGNSLIPPSLLVTDNCQHYNVLVERLRGESGDSRTSAKLDEQENNTKLRSDEDTKNRDTVDTKTFDYQRVKIIEGQYAKFSSGSLTHPFSFNSLYRHTNNDGEPEATTHQHKWITVDYIFYSDLKPLSRYNLPSVSECKILSRIPNNVVGSDHLCLGASFSLKKKDTMRS